MFQKSLLFWLLFFDALLGLGHVLGHFHVGIFSSHWFSIEDERSISECFQYLKEGTALFLLLKLAKNLRARVFNAWALVFAVVLTDDAFELHEHLSSVISRGVPALRSVGIAENALGEAGAMVVLGVLPVLWVLFVHFREGMEVTTRKISSGLFVGFGVLVFFGAVVDFIHAYVTRGHGLLGMVEEGGEMVTMSVIVAFLVQAYRMAPSSSKDSSGVSEPVRRMPE